jgi:metallo-beta-lactamase class B
MRLCLLTVLLTSIGCAHLRDSAGTLHLSDDVDVRPLAPNIWLHTAYVDHQHGIATNGLLVETRDSSVLIDAGWNDGEAARLFDFAASRLHHPIRDVIITHAHADRIGGAGEAQRRGAHVHALARTIAHARQRGQTVPDVSEPEQALLTIGGVEIDLFYPGAGHTDDNLVVYLPATRILYGGCFIKSSTASDLGNIANADLVAWPVSLRLLSEHIPEPTTVVPGHGPLGGDPMGHTAALLRREASRIH